MGVEPSRMGSAPLQKRLHRAPWLLHQLKTQQAGSRLQPARRPPHENVDVVSRPCLFLHKPGHQFPIFQICAHLGLGTYKKEFSSISKRRLNSLLSTHSASFSNSAQQLKKKVNTPSVVNISSGFCQVPPSTLEDIS